MRNAFLKLRLLCWITMVGILVLSCASPNRSDDLTQESSEVGETDGEFSNFSDTKNDDLGDLGTLESSSENKASEASAGNDLMSSDIPESVLLAPSDKEIAKAAKEMAAVDATKVSQSKGTDSYDSFGGGFDEGSKRTSQSGSQRVPKIPGAALNRQGTLLNRFYFLRKGDTAESVATLLYGSAGEAKKLTSWNGKSWRPGKLVYYASPSQPEDQEMRSFYQERNVPPEEYQIQNGETLIKIAKQKYGNSGSWKEIAVINGFSKLSAATPGTRIALYPSDLKAFGTTPSSNNGYRRSAPQAGESTPPSQSTEQAPPPQYADSGNGSEPEVTNPITGNKANAKNGLSLDVMKLFQQNMVAIVFGGGLLLLLFLLGTLSKQRKKRKTNSADEFGDEAFGASPKRSKR